MPIQESPAQRDSREARASFFGMQPLNGPALPGRQSGIRESPAQVKQREAKAAFFEPKSLRPSSLRRVGETAATQDSLPTKIRAVTGGKTQNEARGTGRGTLVIKDCDGVEIVRLINQEGFDDEKEVRSGCEGSSSYPV
jgi:hypothetical protein